MGTSISAGNYLLIAAMTASAGIASTRIAFAQDENLAAQQWLSVGRIIGNHVCHNWSVKDRNEPYVYERGSTDETVSSSFVLVPDTSPESGDRLWVVEKSTLTGQYSLIEDEGGIWRKSHLKIAGGFNTTTKGLQFEINSSEGTWSFSTAGEFETPYEVKFSHILHEFRTDVGKWVTETDNHIEQSHTYASGVMTGKLPDGKPGILTGTDTFTEAMPDHWMTKYVDCRVTLAPVFANVDVVVRLEGIDRTGAKVAYADWLPEALLPQELDDIKPYKYPGARLKVKAWLQTETGGKPGVEVNHFVFKLNRTSKEPSIAMNWPNGYEPEPTLPDIRFEQTGGEMDSSGQRFTVSPRQDEQNRPSAEASVGSYDFGGWSDLSVEVELADGRVIAGHIEGDKNQVLIPLPKRTGGSLIADAWKKQYGITGSDRADDETTPEGESGCDGDGLTRYEEYRGFLNGEHHVRGDPKRKELFIYNECGDVAEPGIAMFQRLSGLKVYKDLLEDQVSCPQGGDIMSADCGINGSFGQGPHRVLQHRVRVLVCDATVEHGGGTIAHGEARSGGVHLRPKDVDNIYVEGPDAEFWANQYGVSQQDKPRQFDVAMAHELFHSVGVEHHGESDGGISFESRAPGEDNIADYHWTGSVTGAGTFRTRLLDEATGQDISARTAKAQQDWGDKRQRSENLENAGIGKSKDYLQYFTVGFPHGQHSGDENCVMRYWLADVYLKQPGTVPDYYVVPDGSERVGNSICTTTEGQSINKMGRHPQPRYFDAAPNRGNCKHWICVNDAIPGSSSEIPEAVP